MPSSSFSRAAPRACSAPEVLAINNATLHLLDLDFSSLNFDVVAAQLSGTTAIEGACPISTAYAGHQYGGFVRLGDGRAILLGEHTTSCGQRFDIQLKGAGRTSYSRRGDGLATLPTMLKEFITSAAMQSLGVSTTTPLALITSGDPVEREKIFPGAVLVRVAKSHIRIGHFEYFTAFCSPQDQRTLLGYAVDRHFPQLNNVNELIPSFFQSVCSSYLALIPKWQGLGFVHGVMNTDNFLVSGETIDYGPCAFMDTFIPSHAYSSIDELGRYCYRMQPWITFWNLGKLAEALAPAATQEEITKLKATMRWFQQSLWESILAEFRTKLGLSTPSSEDINLVSDLLKLLEERVDFTNFFCELGLSILGNAPKKSAIYSSELSGWMARWQRRLSTEGRSKEQVAAQMMTVNPWIIPRSHEINSLMRRSEELDSHQLSNEIQKLMCALSSPYDYSKIEERFVRPPNPDEVILKTFCGT